MSDLPNLWLAAPEILLALTAMGLMMLGVFNSKDMTRPVVNLAVLAMIVAGILILIRSGERVTTFLKPMHASVDNLIDKYELALSAKKGPSVAARQEWAYTASLIRTRTISSTLVRRRC